MPSISDYRHVPAVKLGIPGYGTKNYVKKILKFFVEKGVYKSHKLKKCGLRTQFYLSDEDREYSVGSDSVVVINQTCLFLAMRLAENSD